LLVAQCSKVASDLRPCRFIAVALSRIPDLR
jgi:hypothetical protein